MTSTSSGSSSSDSSSSSSSSIDNVVTHHTNFVAVDPNDVDYHVSNNAFDYDKPNDVAASSMSTIKEESISDDAMRDSNNNNSDSRFSAPSKSDIESGLPISLKVDPVLLKRSYGWASLTAMGIGATIGAGIFVRYNILILSYDRHRVTTGIVAHELAGPAICVSFILAAVVCGLTGLCYAEFAAMAPSAGSAYAYTRASMGQFLGFVIGWDLVLEYAISSAAVAQSWSQYLGQFLQLFNVQVPAIVSQPPFASDSLTGALTATGAIFDMPALVITILLTTLLVTGVKDSARFNNVMVTVKVSIVLFVIVFGATLVEVENYTPFAPFGWNGITLFGNTIVGQSTPDGNARGMIAAAAIVFFAYIGFDAVTTQAEEVERPERNVPIAIFLSLTISTALYIGVAIVITGMIPYTQISEAAPLSAAFGQRGYAWAQYLIALGALIGLTSVLLVTMLGQPRIFLAMARDGLLPPFFADIHPRYRTPWKSTILTGTVVGVVGCLIPLSILIEFVSIGTLLAFTFVSISIIVLRHTSPDIPRPFRCPWVPLVPICGIILSLILMLSLPATNWYRLAAWFGVGLIIYFFYGRKHGIGSEHRIMTQAHMDSVAADAKSSAIETAKSDARTRAETAPVSRRESFVDARSAEAEAPIDRAEAAPIEAPIDAAPVEAAPIEAAPIEAQDAHWLPIEPSAPPQHE